MNDPNYRHLNPIPILPTQPIAAAPSDRLTQDNTLIDLTKWAVEVGFVIPVFCGAAVWREWLDPGPSQREQSQCESERVLNLLWTLRRAAFRRAASGDDCARFEFEAVFPQHPHRQVKIRLTAACTLNDHGEPMLTLRLPPEVTAPFTS